METPAPSTSQTRREPGWPALGSSSSCQQARDDISDPRVLGETRDTVLGKPEQNNAQKALFKNLKDHVLFIHSATGRLF